MPAIAYAEEDTLELRYARSTVAEPSDLSDWVRHKVHDLPWQPWGSLSMIGVDDRPFIAYVLPNGGWHLRYAWADTAAPNATDWTLSAGPIFTDAFFGMSLAEINGGRGVAAYLNGGPSDLVYMSSESTTPAGPADWQSHTVDAADSTGYPCALIEVADRPAIAYANSTHWWLMFAQAQDPSPSGPDDWQLSVVDVCGASISSIDAALVDGRPCVVYESDGELFCAWAKVLQPLVPRDWTFSEVTGSSIDDYEDGSVADLDGFPAVSMYNGTTYKLEFAWMEL